MRLKLYRAATLADAMAQARRDLGPEALILSSRRVSDGVELTAALEQEDEPAAASVAVPVSAAVLDATYHAVPPALAARLVGPDLAHCLRTALLFGQIPIPAGGRGKPLLLAGVPGAGKTLSIARLATRLVLAGLRPVVITADGRRAGGAEELAAYTRLLGLTLLAASTPATLTRALAQAAEGAPVLIDTAGINPFEPADREELAALIRASGATPVLTMPAGADPEEAAEQAHAFAALGVRHLLPTRLDIARRLGSVLAAADTGLILTEAGVGTGATDGLVEITPSFLAARLLQSPATRKRATPETAKAAHAPGPGVGEPAARTLRAAVFPSARAHAADAWDMHHHG